MKIQSQYSLLPALGFTGILLLAGCNSSTSPPAANDAANDVKTSAAPNSAPAAAAPAADGAVAPKRKPPAGLGNAIGRVLYDGKGVPNIEVQLCENLGFISGCEGKTYQSKTDKNGFYILDKVKPGDYALSVRVFDTNKFIYPTSGVLSAAKFKIEKDQTLDVRTVNLWKVNLKIVSPKNGATVNSGTPKLAWQAYPDAENYKVTVRSEQGGGSSESVETSSTSATLEKPLLNGNFEWTVEAFNGESIKLAETADAAKFKVTGQSGSNTLDLIEPKSNAIVSGANLTLKWKAHPQADQYRVYLKGVKAKDPVMSFEAVNGTSYKLPQTLPADDYYWSVNAHKGNDKIAGSTLQKFSVK